MDDFAVDLDKVLDDFELSEDGGGPTAPCPESNGNSASTNRTLNAPGSGLGALCSQQVTPVESSYQPNNVNNQSYSRPSGLPAQINATYQSPQKMECLVSPTHNANIHEANYINGCNNVNQRGPGGVISMNKPLNQGQLDGSFYDPQPQMPLQQGAWVVQHNNAIPYNVNLISEGGVMAHGEQINGSLMRRLSNDRPELLQSMAEKDNSLPHYPGDMPSIHSSGQVVSHIHPDVIPTSMNKEIDTSNHRLASEMQNNGDAEPSLKFAKALSDSPSSTPSQPSQTSSLTTNDDSSECSPELQMSPRDSRQSSLSPEPTQNNVTEAMHVDSPNHNFQEPRGKSDRDTVNPPSEPRPERGMHGVEQDVEIPKESAINEKEQYMQDECDNAASVPGEIPGFPAPSLHRHPDSGIGFGFIQSHDDDENLDEMDEYLAEIEKMEKEPEHKNDFSFQSNSANAFSSKNSGFEGSQNRDGILPIAKVEVPTSLPLSAGEPLSELPSEQCDSGVCLERILMPDIMSPMIATPMDDAGFSKVPGYKPPGTLTSLQEATLNEVEEEEEDASEENMPDDSSSPSLGSSTKDSCVSDSFSGGESVSASALMSETPGTVAQTVSVCSTVSQVQAPDQKQLEHLPTVVLAPEMVTGTTDLTSNNSYSPGANSVSFLPKEEAVDPKRVSNSAPTDPPVPMTTGVGARPKEIVPQGRKSRPNSLIGLSKPDLNIAVPVVSTDESLCSMLPKSSNTINGGVRVDGVLDVSGDQDVTAPKNIVPRENTHDRINLPLGLKNKSPQQKMHLNLEIEQQMDFGNPPVSQTGSPGPVDSRRQEAPYGIGVMTNRAQLAGGIDINLPREVAPAQGNETDALSSPQPDVQGEQSPAPPNQQIPVSAHSSAETHQTSHQQLPQTPDSNSGVPDGSESESAENGASKLKRPTTLSLRPRDEYSLSLDKDSVDDDSATGEDLGLASSGSSGGPGAPYQADDEMSEPPGATASGPGLDIMYSPPEVGPGAFSPAPPCSSNVNVVITQLGKVAPRWVPDSEALNCMQCEARFTFTKRRHHCRACGKVFCSTCCNLKCKLQYMDNKEARVCSKCYQDIVRGSQRSREPKQVMFSDGIRPGGDLTELDNSDVKVPIRRHTRSSKKVERASPSSDTSSDGPAKSPSPKTRTKRTTQPRNACLIPESGLPPVVMSTGIKGDLTLEEHPSPAATLAKIKNAEDPNPVVFAINRNLFVLVKILNLECCVNRVCWCFSTRGMCTVGQEEIVIVLECLPDEKCVPRDIFCHLNSVYDEANKGNTVSHLGHTIFGQSFLDSRDHCGFLYVRPTFQCVQKLILPSPPFVFGLLLQKWETPWAKVFPIRLMLRLGAEYRYYPCPLVSVRFRKPVFGEIGHTIMNLLADFRNYQYMLPQIRGVIIHMEEKKTFINFPRNRYDEIMKVITNSNDHVMALGANFSTDADSHLVCIQNEDGNYQTQAINIQNKPRKVTGSSFVVFNGALKTSSGLRAKSSIVEDGLMVQITNESMAALKAALLDMRDYTIGCGAIDAPAPDEQIIVQWVEDDHKVNIGVKSPIDGRPMDGIESIHIHNSTDYVGESRTIRWTEVFFIQNDDANNSRCEPVDLSRLAETLAQACCIALTPKLDKLKEAGLTKIGLRCTIDRDNVGYEVGSMSERLPDFYMNDLDNELIPVIHNAGSHSQDGPVVLELIFFIIE